MSWRALLSSLFPPRPSMLIRPLPPNRTAVRGFSAQGLRQLNAAAKFVNGSGGGTSQAAHIPTLEEFVEARAPAREIVTARANVSQIVAQAFTLNLAPAGPRAATALQPFA